MGGITMKKTAAAILLALLTMAAPAQAEAQVISVKVGQPLREAMVLIAAKNYKAALVRVNEAEAAESTPDEADIINQMKQLIEVCENRGCTVPQP
jgi:heme A synthase